MRSDISVISFKSPADTPAMPGKLRKSAAFAPRYRKFESISLQERVHCELCPRGPASGRAMLTSPILVHWNQHDEGGPFEPKCRSGSDKCTKTKQHESTAGESTAPLV